MTEMTDTIRERLATAGNDPASAVFVREVEETLSRTELDLGRVLTGTEILEVMQALRDSFTNPDDVLRLDAILPPGPNREVLHERVDAALQELQAESLTDIPAVLARLHLIHADEIRTAAETARMLIQKRRNQ